MGVETRVDGRLKFAVSWGYDVYVELIIPAEIVERVEAGEAVTLRGDGYDYEGESFQDYWDLPAGWAGDVVVRYGLIGDDDFGVGWEGAVSQARVEA